MFVETLLRLQALFKNKTKKGGSNLRKFCSNSRELQQIVAKELQEDISNENDKFDDKIIFDISKNCEKIPENLTKSPVIVKLKILFQDVCCEKFAWDNILPESYLSVFYDILTGLRETKKNYLKEFITLRLLKILYKFAILYKFMVFMMPRKETRMLRLFEVFNFVKVAFVSAKSRVSPLNRITIPRLELLGNLLLSRLTSSVINNSTSAYSIDKSFVWTDFSISYTWIQNINKVY